MEKIILAVSGRKQAGKTETYKFIRDHHQYDDSVAVVECSFATALKKVCVEVLGLTDAQAFGSDDDKNSLVEHLLWDNFPVQSCRFISAISTKPTYRTGPMTAREVLQYWGTDVFRKAYADVWTAATLRSIDKLASELKYRVERFIAVLPDCRFPNEVKATQDAGGKVLRLTRSVFQDSHKSEMALDREVFDWTKFDYVYDNSEVDVASQMVGLTPWLNEIGAL